MKIAPINTDKKVNRNQNFTGLTKIMKRKVFIDGKKDILQILDKRKPHQNSYVGQLPPEIFYRLPQCKAERTAAIHDIMNTFSQIADEIRNLFTYSKNSLDETRNRRPASSVNLLKNLFKKYNLKNTDEDVNLIFLGKGDYGSGYKITGIVDTHTNDRYMLKVHTVADKNPDWHRYKSHGCYSEPNTAAYWTNKWGHETHRGRFYFANIEHGFMMDNFIDSSTPKYKKHVNAYYAGLKLTDEQLAAYGHNKINGYSIDWGGVRVVNRIKNESKTACQILKQIKNSKTNNRAESKWNELLECKGKYDETQKKAGLALAIKCINNKSEYIEKCMDWNIPMVDQALGYVLKYLPHEQALKYFEKLMARNDEVTQIILMNEIPLLARKPLPEAYDDMLVPKSELFPDKIKEFYDIASKYAIPESREHLASYIHLLPHEDIFSEFNKLIKLDDYNIYDRLLHKIRTVPEIEFPFDLKFDMLKEIQKNVKDSFLQKHSEDIRIFTLRKTLED